MTMPPETGDAEASRPYFRRLRELAETIGLAQLSMGTTQDYRVAVDEGAFVLDYIMPSGTSLAETNRVLLHIEKFLRDIPEIESYSRRTGMQLGLAGVTEPNTGDFAVKLKDGARPADDLAPYAAQSFASEAMSARSRPASWLVAWPVARRSVSRCPLIRVRPSTAHWRAYGNACGPGTDSTSITSPTPSARSF